MSDFLKYIIARFPLGDNEDIFWVIIYWFQCERFCRQISPSDRHGVAIPKMRGGGGEVGLICYKKILATMVGGRRKLWIFKALKWLFLCILWIKSLLFQKQLCYAIGEKYINRSKTWYILLQIYLIYIYVTASEI